MKIAVSTVAFIKTPVEEIIEKAERNNWTIEFSSGVPYRSDLKDLFLAAKLPRLIHNYFPPPQIPFVLNLASDDNQIRRRTIEHCKQGLELAKKSRGSFYSAHAGFCIDPLPNELGKPLAKREVKNREKNWKLFLESLKELLKSSKELGISFLAENNVLAQFNLMNGVNPLFCCDPREMVKLIDEINDPYLGILLDTGHLKVSAQTLGFDLDVAVKSIAPFIRCVHHSDNDGNSDINDKLDQKYWFLKHMVDFKNATHVIEVKNLNEEAIKNHILLLERAAK